MTIRTYGKRSLISKLMGMFRIREGYQLMNMTPLCLSMRFKE